MTRLNRTINGAQGSAIAAIHERGDKLALVVVRNALRPAIALSRTFARTQEADILSTLTASGTARLVRIAPARRTICRVAPVPAGTPEELDAAASLLAEGTLPEEIPPHRRAAGILPGAGAGGASALLTAWRDGDDTVMDFPWPDNRWTTEVAAIAFLSGCRGAAAAGHFEGGAISIVVPGVGRCAARVLVESAESRGAWDAAFARHLSETCAAVNAEQPSFAPGHSLVLSGAASGALRSAVDGIPADPAWLDTYGVALGAALVALAPEPGAARLAGLRPEPPSQRVPLPERAASWMNVPRNAAALIALAVVAMLLAPLGLAASRLAVLSRKSSDLGDQDRSRVQVQQRAALYRELDQVRWPMTKLIADISAATPEGVTVDSLRLSPDQGLSIQGSAESQEVLNQLQKNLNDTGLFEKVKAPRSEQTSNGVSFDISAEVVNPHTPVKPADDFAAKPLAVRLYGEDAASGRTDNDSYAGSGESGGRREGRGNREDRAGREDRGERRGRGGDGPSARPAPVKYDIPSALTDEQIAAMTDYGAVIKEWSNRKKVASSGQPDAPTKTRLDHEVEKLAERRDALKQAGGAK